MLERLPNPQLRKLKAMGQRLDPMLKIGKAGLTEGFLNQVNQNLEQHELIKIKFEELKEEKKELAPRIAEQTSSHLVHQVGNVIVLYRENPNPDKRKIRL
ncbi:MAG: YhbY family RNA-binding protein [Limisphaerales bacterium]